MKEGDNLACPDVQTAPAPWVVETARFPIAFAQVREDALLDQWVADQLEPGAEVLMVASGGCTAALLASTSKFSRLHLVDLNPAQIALSRLKLRLLETTDIGERLSILGHNPMPVSKRRLWLTRELQALNLCDDALGPMEFVAEQGPDRAGRYEVLFAKFAEGLGEVADELTALLQLSDPVEQARRADPITHFGQALDRAFDRVMTLPNLVGLFGEAATRNRVEPFCRHFARRTRHALATLPAANNPYLWQMLRGQFSPGVTYPWLGVAKPSRMPKIEWTVGSMLEELQRKRQTVDFLHLSNILDWLEPNEARSILALAREALRPGGWILIRQLNSLLDIESLGELFVWDSRASKLLHDRDRSFFYRRLHLGRR